ncbi:hypothetical protein BDV40DRAFT_293218 [Aspergillus tamarii]|uniref:Aminoglycoside phosphotransferase domain-containing protein n=1 Tax=Aspergillus tamarii TaxID=41984 RepID=A0A5N6UDT6_ASPTM|nr:hypothetical protein BDV40DRAFT_293218 [Aspergillus tamarii]
MANSTEIWFGRRIFGAAGRLGVRASRNRIVKGPCEAAELTALQYIARHTTDGLYIELEYIQGMDLSSAWLGDYLSPAQKKQIVSEIAVNIPIEDSTQVLGQEFTDCHPRSYRSCFTHTDLCPRNIIVDNDRATALIDWEFGGWYREYTKAHYVQLNMPDWYEGLESAITR